MITVRAPSPQAISISMIWLSLRGSSPAVGSSSSNTSGSSTRTDASATRFFSPPDKPMRRTTPQMTDLHQIQHRGDSLNDLLLRPAKLQRRKRHFIENRRVKKLNFRILKHQPHTPPEIESEFIPLERLRSERAAVK